MSIFGKIWERILPGKKKKQEKKQEKKKSGIGGGGKVDIGDFLKKGGTTKKSAEEVLEDTFKSVVRPRGGGGGGGGGGAGGGGGGRSYYDPKTGKGYYVLPSGEKVEATTENLAAVEKLLKAGGTTKAEFETIKKALKEETIDVSAGAGKGVVVRRGGKTIRYTGEAFIPELGMTANEFERKLREEALKKGEIKPSDIGRVRWSLKYTPEFEIKKQDIGEQFKEYAARYGAEVERYKQAGYSEKQAMELAEYSLLTQTTPTPEFAQSYLKTKEIFRESRQVPEGFLPKVEWGVEQAFKSIDIGLKELGVPKGYRTFSFGITPSKTSNIINIIPEKYRQVPIGTILPIKIKVGTLGGFGMPNLLVAPTAHYEKGYATEISLNPIETLTSFFKLEGTVIPFQKKQVKVGELTVGQAADIVSWFVPYVGEARAAIFLGSFGERGARGAYKVIKEQGVRAIPSAAWEYTKEHPFEVGIASLITGAGVAKIWGRLRLGRLSKKYVPIEETGIEYVPSATIPRKVSYLSGFEEKTATMVHVTTHPKMTLKSGEIILETTPELQKYATGWRKQLQQFSFYTSAPEIIEGAQKPVAYLYYAGIGEEISSSIKTIFSWRKPKTKAFLIENVISKTPESLKGLPPKELVQWQMSQAGKTFVPGENILGISREGQFVTSVKWVERGYAGSKLVKSDIGLGLAGKFTYYPQYRQAPQFIERSKYLKKIWKGLTTKYHKIYFEEARIEPLSLESAQKIGGVASKSKIASKARIDLIEYASSYGRVRYITPSTIISSISSIFPKYALGISSISKVSSRKRASFPYQLSISRVSYPSSKISSVVSKISFASRQYSSRVSSAISSIPSAVSSITKYYQYKAPKPVKILSYKPPFLFIPSFITKTGIGKLPAITPKGYTPSYFAYVFGIRGRKPKRQTGLEVRPIVGGKLFDIKIKPINI